MNHRTGEFFDTQFAAAPLMAILRGFSREATLELAERAWALGIDVVEVPVQDAASLDVLRALVTVAHRRGHRVGAGTILESSALAAVADAGASFTVSPGFDPALARAAAEVRMPHLPGVGTATEVHAALRAGLRWLKAFPAAALGPAWFEAMRGPFPEAAFVATGGIAADAAERYFAAGARVVAVGSALADPAELTRLSQALARRAVV